MILPPMKKNSLLISWLDRACLSESPRRKVNNEASGRWPLWPAANHDKKTKQQIDH